MAEAAVKITDKQTIYEIFRTRFKKGRIFIKTADLNIQADSFSFNDGVISISAPDKEQKIKSVIFYIRENEEVVFSHAILKNTNDAGLLIYEPLDIQILKIPRKEGRKTIAAVDSEKKIPVYVSNIISDFIILECIELAKRKVDIIRDELLKKFKEIYSDSDMTFINEKPNDPRMAYFKNYRKPYFIKDTGDMNDPEKLKADDDLKYFKSFIFPREPLVHQSKMSSEIAVPLLYKMMMPFGYVKAANFKGFTDKDFSIIRKFGMSASTVYTNDKQIIVSSDDKIAVTDLSMSGLGIFFKEKVLIKHFKESSLIIFSIFLPDKKQATMLCIVRNISLIKNNIYRIGCEILNIEALGEVYYSEYLEGTG
jgi:hypothetical protein